MSIDARPVKLNTSLLFHNANTNILRNVAGKRIMTSADAIAMISTKVYVHCKISKFCILNSIRYNISELIILYIQILKRNSAGSEQNIFYNIIVWCHMSLFKKSLFSLLEILLHERFLNCAVTLFFPFGNSF